MRKIYLPKHTVNSYQSTNVILQPTVKTGKLVESHKHKTHWCTTHYTFYLLCTNCITSLMRVDYGPKPATMAINIVMLDHYRCCYCQLKAQRSGLRKVCRCRAQLSSNLGTCWRRVVKFTPQLQHPQKYPTVPNEYEVGWVPVPFCAFCPSPA